MRAPDGRSGRRPSERRRSSIRKHSRRYARRAESRSRRIAHEERRAVGIAPLDDPDVILSPCAHEVIACAQRALAALELGSVARRPHDIVHPDCAVDSRRAMKSTQHEVISRTGRQHHGVVRLQHDLEIEDLTVEVGRTGEVSDEDHDRGQSHGVSGPPRLVPLGSESRTEDSASPWTHA